MTSRDFRAIAQALHKCKPPDSDPSYLKWKEIRNALAKACQSSNPRFLNRPFYQQSYYGVGSEGGVKPGREADQGAGEG